MTWSRARPQRRLVEHDGDAVVERAHPHRVRAEVDAEEVAAVRGGHHLVGVRFPPVKPVRPRSGVPERS